MWSSRARDTSELGGCSAAVHDAYLTGGYEYDRDAQLVVIPFLQEGWADEPILGVDFDARTHQVRVVAEDLLRVTVRSLDVEVEISPVPGGHVRRRVGRLTQIQSDSWLDQVTD